MFLCFSPASVLQKAEHFPKLLFSSLCDPVLPAASVMRHTLIQFLHGIYEQVHFIEHNT